MRLEKWIIAFYAKKMTTKKIQEIFSNIYELDISKFEKSFKEIFFNLDWLYFLQKQEKR